MVKEGRKGRGRRGRNRRSKGGVNEKEESDRRSEVIYMREGMEEAPTEREKETKKAGRKAFGEQEE